MPKKVWGIDISKTSIKAVQVIAEGTGLTITALDVEELPRGSTDQAQIEGHIRDGLSKLMSRNRMRGQKIACSLPGHAVFNRPVKLPPGDPERIQERVRYEAQQQIPFPLNEVIWDSYLVDRKYSVGEEMEVILFAIKRDVVDHFLSLLTGLGLSPDVIQFSPVALYNFLVHDQDAGSASVALDIGADNTDLIVVDGPRCWIRNLPITGNDLTKALHKELGVPLAEAEKLKVTAAQSQQQGKLFAAMQPVLKDLVGEIHRSIGYYKSISRLNKFDKIFLLGNGAKTIHIAKFVSQNLQLDATRLASLSKIAVSSTVDQARLQAYLDTIGPALGLALQAHGLSRMNINLLPEEERGRREEARRRPIAAAAVLLLALPVYLLYSAAAQEKNALIKASQGAKAALETYEQTTSSLKKAMAPLPAYEKELATLSHIVLERDVPLKVLDAINKIVKDTETLPPDQRLWLLSTRLTERPVNPDAAPAGAAGYRPWVTPDASAVEVMIEGAIPVIPQRGNTQQAYDYIAKRLGEPIQKAFQTEKPSLTVKPQIITDLQPSDVPKTISPLGTELPAVGSKYFAFTASWKIRIGESSRKPAAPKK